MSVEIAKWLRVCVVLLFLFLSSSENSLYCLLEDLLGVRELFFFQTISIQLKGGGPKTRGVTRRQRSETDHLSTDIEEISFMIAFLTKTTTKSANFRCKKVIFDRKFPLNTP